MFAATNLAGKMEKRLPADLVSLMLMAAKKAERRRERLYLVGGAVRDLLLHVTTFDLDLVVEGNAILLAEELSREIPAQITTHPRFQTAKLKWQNRFSADLTTARKESYAYPGALPIVETGSLTDDLFRRDFTINAMAISLNPEDYGNLIDPYDGRHDLERKLIRILHRESFIHDATRIWRAVRYAERLNFSLEENTFRLLRQGINMLDTISGDRIRYELECVLQEDFPEKALNRADELGVLARLNAALKGNRWLADKFQTARVISAPEKPPQGLYLALMAFPLTGEETERLISFLHFNRTVAGIMRDTGEIRGKLVSLNAPGLSPGDIYHLLHGCATIAIQAVSLAADLPPACERMNLYLNKLRFVRPSLRGEDLKKMGIAEGHHMKEILGQLLDARLDGSVTSRKEEETMVREWSHRSGQ
ncbi:MAG: CCA tRNA nucleotidyltransferase [Chloroflexota bacterium]